MCLEFRGVFEPLQPVKIPKAGSDLSASRILAAKHLFRRTACGFSRPGVSPWLVFPFSTADQMVIPSASCPQGQPTRSVPATSRISRCEAHTVFSRSPVGKGVLETMVAGAGLTHCGFQPRLLFGSPIIRNRPLNSQFCKNGGQESGMVSRPNRLTLPARPAAGNYACDDINVRRTLEYWKSAANLPRRRRTNLHIFI
jgi:hypothetical protein